MERKRIKYVAGLAAFLLVICLFRSCRALLSEDKFRLTYDDKNDEFDEEYIITIPK